MDNLQDNQVDTTKTNEDRKELCLEILKQLDQHADDKSFFLSETRKGIKLQFNEKQLAIWENWKRQVSGVLYEAKLLDMIDNPAQYRRIISNVGREFLQQTPQAIDERLNKMWQAYEDDMKLIKSPISVDQYVDLLRRWIAERSKLTELDSKRVFCNIKRMLAELYFANKVLTYEEIGEKVGNQKSAMPALEASFGKFLAEELKRPKKAYSLNADLFLDGQHFPNFRAALKSLNEQNEIDLEEWKKIPVDPKNAAKISKLMDSDGNNIAAVQLQFAEIDDILAYKKQVILYGPPGTGKTYWANEYVEYKIEDEEERERRVFWCTFHPEYGYEHFIEGYRPTVENRQMGFELNPGIFKTICGDAKKSPDEDFYLIIDEINRGDIPRIFGELISLIEADKRGEMEVMLPHSQDSFTVPKNVYIIATMNTADRSIALLDTALRRRFGFHELKPDSSAFEKVGLQFSVPTSGKSLAKWFDELNEKLATVLKEKRHDAEYILIGHSYFLQLTNLESDEEKNRRFTQIIRHEILPLIQEYCYEDATARKTLADWIRDTTSIDTDSATSDEVNSD